MTDTRESLVAMARNAFPDEEAASVLSMLDEYIGPERERVQGAILKLSRGDVSKLLHNVAAARQDYRDVLWWSETQA
jgi:hypothetical protein